MTQPANHLETLLAYADGALSPSRSREVEAHLATHSDDADLVSQYRLIKQRVSSDDSTEPSASAIARARAIFNPAALPKKERASWLAAADRFVARCVFDSRVEALAVRSAGAEQLVNVSYEAAGAEIDIQAERVETGAPGAKKMHWHILGQINTIGEAGAARIALTQSGSIAPIMEFNADEHGSFSIQTMPGRYDLHIRLSSGVVVLPNLNMT
jgi:hypothetical protein